MNAIIVSFLPIHTKGVGEVIFSAGHFHQKIAKTSYKIWKDSEPSIEYLKVCGVFGKCYVPLA